MTAPTPEPGHLDKKTILIVDDHPILRSGIASLIESEPDLVVWGEAASRASALDAVRKSQPDLVIVDIMLEGSNGLDLVKDLKTRHPKIPALVISMHDEAVYGERSLRAGARGYISKRHLTDIVLVAIRRLLDGQTYMSDTLQERLAAKLVGGRTLATDTPLDALSDRQLEVFRRIGEGRTTRQIADALALSVKTIESHREQIKLKLSLKSAAELAQRATQWIETAQSK